MAHIAVIGTGGTIASRSTENDQGKIAVAGAGAILESLGADRLPRGVTVDARDAGTMNSFNLTFRHARRIAKAIADTLAEGFDGVVVTHGTDTLEETAFLHDLTCDDPRPVVFTGSQHAADAKEGDGPGNVADAIAVAADPASRERGALVVFSGDILPVRGTLKAKTFAAQPFAARLGGQLGLVHEGMVHYESRPEPWRRLKLPGEDFETLRISTITNVPGLPDGDGAAEAALRRGADGIIILGTGAGNTNRPMVQTIAMARAAHVPVVLSSRVPFGHVTPTYGNGGAVNAVAAGAIPVWSIPFTQARLLLATVIDEVGPQRARDVLSGFDDRTGVWAV